MELKFPFWLWIYWLVRSSLDPVFWKVLISTWNQFVLFFSSPHQQDQHFRVFAANLDHSWILVWSSTVRLGELHRQETNKIMFCLSSAFTDLTLPLSLTSNVWSLCRSWVWNLWDRLGQSKLLECLQVLHHLHPNLLLPHPRAHHALLLRVHHQHSEERQRSVSRGRPDRPPEEAWERRHYSEFVLLKSQLSPH